MHSSELLLAAAATGCSSSSTTLVTPSGPSTQRCAVTLKVSTSSITSAGGSGTVSVATERECEWTVKAESDWLTFNGPTTGQGPADRAFSVQPNRSISPRSVEVSVADQRATISQEAATCPWKVSPPEVVMGPAGGDRTVSLSTEDFCSWTVTSRESWVTVASASNGKGTTDIILRIGRNDGPERIANIEMTGGNITACRAASASANTAEADTSPDCALHCAGGARGVRQRSILRQPAAGRGDDSGGMYLERGFECDVGDDLQRHERDRQRWCPTERGRKHGRRALGDACDRWADCNGESAEPSGVRVHD
jgi:hypothetical protein